MALNHVVQQKALLYAVKHVVASSFSWLKLIVAASSPLQQVSLVINII